MTFTWDPGVESTRVKLQGILESWKGTPYMEGARSKGVGVDCVRFVVSVFDELAGTSTDITTLPRDAHLHAAALSRAAMHQILTLFTPTTPVYDRALLPGDVLVTGPPGGGPGHAMIVGYETNTLWEASRDGVLKTSFAAASTNNRIIFRIIRIVNTTYRWLRTEDLLLVDQELEIGEDEPTPIS